MNYLKYLLAASPALIVVLAQFGIVITETQVATWVNAVMVLAGVIGSAVPSLKAVKKYGENAD
jgi:hypothetical protein